MRDQFELDPALIHMSSLLVSSHPRPVREAIERYRRELDRNPAGYLEAENSERQAAAAQAAADYLGTSSDRIVLTDSTTMGLGLVYNGLRLSPGDEILTTAHDYYATHESLRTASERSGARVREIALFDSLDTVTEDEIVERIGTAITPATRLLALTWVHSGSGLKIPVRRIAERVREAEQAIGREVLLSIDGVHAFGIEDFEVEELGCDFLMAGTHKWMFGPRGTGIAWGSDRAMEHVVPVIPSFQDSSVWRAWIRNTDPPGTPDGRRLSPGGFKPFEHQWAMKEAFEFHQEIGKDRIEQRTHSLASHLKEGLASIQGVRLITPRSPELSAGIVCFEMDGLGPEGVVDRLRERDIIASVTPYATSYARLTPAIVNDQAEVDLVLEAVRDLA